MTNSGKDYHQKPINLNKEVSIQWCIEMKVTYTDKNGKKVEQTFNTEDEGKKLKEKLKAQGVTGAKWEW